MVGASHGPGLLVYARINALATAIGLNKRLGYLVKQTNKDYLLWPSNFGSNPFLPRTALPRSIFFIHSSTGLNINMLWLMHQIWCH